MNLFFQDKVVLVTGGSTGIGAAIAKGFGAAGAKVAVHYLTNEEKANQVVSSIKEMGADAISVRADMTSASDVKNLYSVILQHYGRVDILINNAGSMVERCPFENLSEEVWDQVYNINVKSIFLSTKEAVPIMKKQGGGVVINTASVAARNGGGPGAIHYASAKGAVMTLTKGLAKELLPYHIRVNGINPGVISTPFHEKFSPDKVRDQFLKGIPMGREGTPEEIAGAVLFLASDYASYICGEHIEINGGQWMD
ncbi:3-oxoacyl-[acyl-carrier protein] reductase [Bacillus oleivorans]|uniref:3-oxoacyl-[acyl-carrier protein] reductase n=1 Tax=Bacillus oleivorans TaxID=1448271 RepID=A0A285CSJ8_9BACI|nr:SDR family NAD(P)-dependent oxidoreductase [Bacillus oleivorans]SNX70560.1 3-oxoacyl-[acyl-carrier protein] reductase [Bacillus oleivorans]